MLDGAASTSDDRRMSDLAHGGAELGPSSISVPCGSCATAVGLDEPACRSCGTPLTRELAAALEERVEAASPELHDLRGRVASAQYAVLIVGLLYFGMAALHLGVVEDRDASDWLAVYGNVTIGAGFVGLFAVGRWFAGPAVFLALVFGVAIQSMDVVASPAAFFVSLASVLGLAAWSAKIAVALVLGRAALASVQAVRLRNSFSAIARAANQAPPANNGAALQNQCTTKCATATAAASATAPTIHGTGVRRAGLASPRSTMASRRSALAWSSRGACAVPPRSSLERTGRKPRCPSTISSAGFFPSRSRSGVRARTSAG